MYRPIVETAIAFSLPRHITVLPTRYLYIRLLPTLTCSCVPTLYTYLNNLEINERTWRKTLLVFHLTCMSFRGSCYKFSVFHNIKAKCLCGIQNNNIIFVFLVVQLIFVFFCQFKKKLVLYWPIHKCTYYYYSLFNLFLTCLI